MDHTKILGRVIAFKGENDYFSEDGIPLEVTEAEKDGTVEVAFNFPGNLRIYVAFRAEDLIGVALRYGKE